jgi:hypothetical protein
MGITLPRAEKRYQGVTRSWVSLLDFLAGSRCGLAGLEPAPLGRGRFHARHYLVWAMMCRFDSGPNDP